jgi:hypothetical protein
MRIVLLATAIVVALGAMAPAAVVAADRPVPRVVLIVGPSGAATDRYRSEARAAADVAREFTSDVTEIYSPNATWPVVRDALQGASLVIYMGHGNGWPSPYRDELYPPTQNGFGLNPKPGGGDDAHQYFGEDRIAKDVELASHAVVLLHHLCYASGLSEPGLPEGTLDMAKQRVDNFAAGFIAAGADAVIAEAYSSPSRYVTAILGGHRSVDAIWRSAPNANDHVLSFESGRSRGYLAQMDPASEDSGFERSIVLKRGLVSADVLAGASGAPRGPFVADPLLPSLVQTGIALRTPTLAGPTLAGSTLRLRIPYAIADRGRLPESIAASLRWEAVDRPAVAPTTDLPATFHLVTAESPGAVVEPTTFKMVSTKLGVRVKLPDLPGTYRLTVTLHDDTGLAFDAATQALLPALLVRVTGEVDGAVLAPAATTVVPGTDATTLAVRVINLGTSPWGRETVPAPLGRPVARRVTAILVGHVVSLSPGAKPIADLRMRLPAGLAPRATAALTVDLSALTEAGDYLVLLDVEIPDQGSLTALGLAPTIVRVHVEAPLPPADPDAAPTEPDAAPTEQPSPG